MDRTVRDWMHSKRKEGYTALNRDLLREYRECLTMMEGLKGFRASEKYRIMTVMTDLENYRVEKRWEQTFREDIDGLRDRCRYLTIVSERNR